MARLIDYAAGSAGHTFAWRGVRWDALRQQQERAGTPLGAPARLSLNGKVPAERVRLEAIGDPKQHLVPVELAIAVAEIGIPIFETRGDAVPQDPLDAAADQPAVTILR